MLAIRVRVRPWSERDCRSSSGRATAIWPSSSFCTVMGAATVWLSVPLGPFTVTTLLSRLTSTPDGTGMGSLPMRDIAVPTSSLVRSPDVGEDFPTHALLVRLAVGQQSLARRDDRDAQAAEHLRQAAGLGVHAQAGLADAADAGDRALPVLAVLQRDRQRLADSALDGLVHLVGGHVALLLEDVGDARLQLAVGHGHRVVVRLVGVAQTGQHVCDRVSHRHGRGVPSRRGFRLRTFDVSSSLASSRDLEEWVVVTRRTWSRRAARPGAPSPAGRSGTGRTCGRPPWAGRSAGSGCNRAPRTSASGP